MTYPFHQSFMRNDTMFKVQHRVALLKSGLCSLLQLNSNNYNTSLNDNLRRHSSLLQKQLYEQIKVTGPISVADFMLQTLTSPDKGYYMKKDVFGKTGDFVTSPELSQMFGELIAVWVVNEWIASGSPSKIQIVEFGPGRGTLMDDMMRTFTSLNRTMATTSVSIHLVEISPYLSKLQLKNLCEADSIKKAVNKAWDFNHTLQGKSKYGQNIYWNKGIENVPKDVFTFFIAHEFFDALPVHKFVKDKKTWKEMYVDICPDSKSSKFRFVLTPHPTVATQTLIKPEISRKHVEVSPKAGAIVHEISKRVNVSGGMALIADYGHFGTKEDTLRGFKSHQVVDVLTNVGETDITADVDFKYLKEVAESCNVDTKGPITQECFLKNMGIDTRIMMLLRNCQDEETKRKLIGSYDMLTNPNKMGEKFKFFTIVNKNRSEKTPVTAFE